MKRKRLLCVMAISLGLGVTTNCMAFESLKIGAHGNSVAEIQNALISLGYLSGGADGSLGSDTEAAIIKFQEENELDATGVVGEATYKKIMSAAGMSFEEKTQKKNTEDVADENDVSEKAKESAITDLSEAQSLDDIRYYIETKGKELGDDLETRTTETLAKVDPYSNYKDNHQAVKDYYSGVEMDSQDLYDLMKDSAITYYEMIQDTVGFDDYSSWNSAMDDFYKTWNDTIDDYYKDWNGSYEDIYDGLDDIISDGYDVADYSEVSDAWSTMYEDYSASWSSMYDLHSNFWSYMYTLHSEVWGEMYDNNLDIDAAVAVAEAELAEKESNKETGAVEAEETKVTEKPIGTEASTANADTSSDGVSAEFKETMDSYEKFFDDYVDIMQKMADNPSDLTILGKYTEFMGKYTETMTKFESMEDSDMNEAEVAYYIEVQTRINQKLSGAIQ